MYNRQKHQHDINRADVSTRRYPHGNMGRKIVLKLCGSKNLSPAKSILWEFYTVMIGIVEVLSRRDEVGFEEKQPERFVLTCSTRFILPYMSLTLFMVHMFGPSARIMSLLRLGKKKVLMELWYQCNDKERNVLWFMVIYTKAPLERTKAY